MLTLFVADDGSYAKIYQENDDDEKEIDEDEDGISVEEGSGYCFVGFDG